MTSKTKAAIEPTGQAEFDRFLLLAIHDLKAPVRRSLLRAQLLQRSAGGTIGPEGEAHLAAIVDANRVASTLLTRVAEFCHAGSRTGLVPPASAGVLVRGAIQALGASADLRVELGEMPGEAVPASLQKVFIELLDNACKFRRRASDPVELRVTSAHSGSRIVFEVHDNGLGFDPRFADLVWEPFQKLHSSEYPGAGLGLAIVRRIVQAYGGETWATSVAGEGSTFGFAVPSEL